MEHNATGDEYNIFRVIEFLEPDMSDYKEGPYELKSVREDVGGTDYSLRFLVSYKLLNYQSILDMVADSDFSALPSKGETSYLISPHEENNPLTEVLPTRHCTMYVNVFHGDERDIINRLYEKDGLLKKLSALSMECLGFDLSANDNMQILGDTYVIRYHPHIIDVDLTESTSPTGVVLQPKLRAQNGKKETFEIILIDKHKQTVIQNSSQTFSTDDNVIRIPLKTRPDMVQVMILDKDGDIIYCNSPQSFVRGFKTNIALNTMDVYLTDAQTGKSTVVHKTKASRSYIGETNSQSYDPLSESVTEDYDKLEAKLTLAFFPMANDESEQKQIRQKAITFIRRILNNAKDEFYIYDPNFSSKDFENFIYQISSIDVDVKILTSSELSNLETEKHLLEECLSKYNNITGEKKAEVRIFTNNLGRPHDRYIVSDDDVWFLGTSLNNIGDRATTIVKVPAPESQKIIKEIKEWFDKANPV